MSRADDKINEIYENAKSAMARLSNKNYRYAGQDAVYDDLKIVQKLIDSFEDGDWVWKNEGKDEQIQQSVAPWADEVSGDPERPNH